MAVFGQITAQNVYTSAVARGEALLEALEAWEDVYLWVSQNSLADLEAPPLNFPAADAQAVQNAASDAHDFYQTGEGTAGFPTATLPYNFLASIRAIVGPQH